MYHSIQKVMQIFFEKKRILHTKNSFEHSESIKV